MKKWKHIHLVFSKSKKRLPIASWLIRLWTWKPFSHVARLKTIMNENMYYQASEGKVNYEHESIFSKKHEIIYKFSIKVPEEFEKSVGLRCLQQAGQPYATKQNIGIILVDALSLIGIKIKNPWKKGVNCSELIYKEVLKPMYPELSYNPDTIKPHHIKEILEEKGYKPC